MASLRGPSLFFLTADDGARVWLDGNLIIDAWDFGYKQRKVKIYIDTTGDHELQVAYFEKTGKARINFEWLQLGGEDDIVGAWRGEYFNNRDLAGDPTVVRQLLEEWQPIGRQNIGENGKPYPGHS